MEDELLAYPERLRWEIDLWVWTDECDCGGPLCTDGQWIAAPRVKVWRHGERGIELPILRTGLRTTTLSPLREFDVPFVSIHDHRIARFAAERAEIALPCKVDLTRYTSDRRLYGTTITVRPEDN